MKLESLANELLLEIFEFFDGIHLFRTFHNLNSRFNTLLFVHFRKYDFDFRNVSTDDFDQLCQQYLPLIIDRITMLYLSNYIQTPDTFFF
jgi:hypothetical protein